MISWTELAEPLLDALAEAFSTEGKPFDCAVLTHGDPAVDCANMLAIGIDVVPVTSTQCTTVYNYDLQIVVLRAVPTLQDSGDPWPAEVYTQNAKDLAADLTILQQAVSLARTDGTVPSERCKTEIRAVEAIPPDGGTAGWSLVLRVNAV